MSSYEHDDWSITARSLELVHNCTQQLQQLISTATSLGYNAESEFLQLLGCQEHYFLLQSLAKLQLSHHLAPSSLSTTTQPDALLPTSTSHAQPSFCSYLPTTPLPACLLRNPSLLLILTTTLLPACLLRNPSLLLPDVSPAMMKTLTPANNGLIENHNPTLCYLVSGMVTMKSTRKEQRSEQVLPSYPSAFPFSSLSHPAITPIPSPTNNRSDDRQSTEATFRKCQSR